MAKYIIKREYNTKVIVNGVEVESVISSSKEIVTGNMITVADSMVKANDYIKSLRIKGVSFGEQRYNRDDALMLGFSFASIYHKHESKIIAFSLTQVSERISD